MEADRHDAYLFSYGTLRNEEVQLATFGRRLEGQPDCLDGYCISVIEITDKSFVESSGSALHRDLRFTGRPADFVDGMALSVTKDELEKSDAYEPDGYHRKLVSLRSGKKAWIYLTQEDPAEELL